MDENQILQPRGGKRGHNSNQTYETKHSKPGSREHLGCIENPKSKLFGAKSMEAGSSPFLEKLIFRGQGGHFQTHFEGHFQTQTTVNSVLTARDSISGPRKPRVISKHDQGVISNTLTKPWGHFQTQAYFLLPGTAFSGLSISFHVAPTHTFRLRLGGDWGLGWGLGWGKPLTLIKQHCSTHTHL